MPGNIINRKVNFVDESNIYKKFRDQLERWRQDLCANTLKTDGQLYHTFVQYFAEDPLFLTDLQNFAKIVAFELEPLVEKNHLSENLPQLNSYDSLGNFINKIQYSPLYENIGNLIYQSGITRWLTKPGKLTYSLALHLLSSHAGEAGHNCPIACSAGIIRILNQYPELPNSQFYLDKLTESSFTDNFTGAQFLTEIQGGSDVGLNACQAKKDAAGIWRIYGEKWFCSNASADLILLTARFDPTLTGTRGLGLFLIPAQLNNQQSNFYYIRRLKNKTGTCTLATAEIDFLGAQAIPVGPLEAGQGIRLMLENVLHISRIFNSSCVLGMTRRAYQTAFYFSQHRIAFNQPIIKFPLVQQQLAKIKAIYTAQIAGCFRIAYLQDQFDLQNIPNREAKLLLRLLVNLQKYFTAKFSVENIRHCLDILAGNGTIHSFSSIPRLLNDAIVCENWEGTHFTLWMQILRDIERYQVEKLFLNYLDNEIKALPVNQIIPEINQLHNQIKKLCADLSDTPTELKTLKIENVVLNMAVLFCGIELLKEITVSPSSSKEACLHLFLAYFTCHRIINPIYLNQIKQSLFKI